MRSYTYQFKADDKGSLEIRQNGPEVTTTLTNPNGTVEPVTEEFATECEADTRAMTLLDISLEAGWNLK